MQLQRRFDGIRPIILLLLFLKHACEVPALAVRGSGPMAQLPSEDQPGEHPSGLLDSILWMAAPKKRRTIEVNRTRRRANEKLIKVQVPTLMFYILGTITRLMALKLEFKMYFHSTVSAQV